MDYKQQLKTNKHMKAIENLIGTKVIIRATNAGVFYGTLKEKEERTVALADARRIWYWNGANSLSQIAAEGVKDKKGSKISVALELMVIEDVIEILPCTKLAVDNLNTVPLWQI